MATDTRTFPEVVEDLREHGFPWLKFGDGPWYGDNDVELPNGKIVLHLDEAVVHQFGPVKKSRFERHWKNLLNLGKVWASHVERDRNAEELITTYRFYE